MTDPAVTQEMCKIGHILKTAADITRLGSSICWYHQDLCCLCQKDVSRLKVVQMVMNWRQQISFISRKEKYVTDGMDKDYFH